MSSIYAARRKRLLNAMQSENMAAVILTSRENTRYFTGFSGTTSVAYLTATEAAILVDFRYVEQAKSQCSDLPVIEVDRQVLSALNNYADKWGDEKVGVEDHDLVWRDLLYIRQGNPQAEFVPSSAWINALRTVKDSGEQELIQKAALIADRAFAELLPYIKPGVPEQELAGRLEFFMRAGGAEGPSFETIVASGVRSAMPHGVASEKKIEFGDPVVFDFGCLYKGYCSDMTRTVFVGEVSDKMREVYDVVSAAQTAALKQIKAGLTGANCDSFARDVIEEAGYGAYFGHSLGHSLGLLIHESPNFSPRSTEIIPEGAVLSVEPGIYLPGIGGVRIEDIGVVKKDGFENFTTSPKELLVLPV